jgi:hypothetical protein
MFDHLAPRSFRWRKGHENARVLEIFGKSFLAARFKLLMKPKVIFSRDDIAP